MAKIFTMKVSIAGCDMYESFDEAKGVFRTIEIKGSDSLYDLAAAINKAFDFNFDHAFGFYNNVKDWRMSNERYELFADIAEEDGDEVEEGVQGVENTRISSVFSSGKKMLFYFDYGDGWQFVVECKEISDSKQKVKYPLVSESYGEAPEQYPAWDEDDDDDEDGDGDDEDDEDGDDEDEDDEDDGDNDEDGDDDDDDAGKKSKCCKCKKAIHL
jgi:hypothetical protein